MIFQVTIMFGQRFVRFFGHHFKYCWVIFIMRYWDWNFRFLDSDFFLGLMLYHCLLRWPNIKTRLHRRFVFDAITTVSSMLKCRKVLLSISMTQCRFNAEQPSATLAPHWNIIGYRYMVQVCLSLLTMGPYIRWPRFMGFFRHVHHCTNINPHSDPDNPE